MRASTSIFSRDFKRLFNKNKYQNLTAISKKFKLLNKLKIQKVKVIHIWDGCLKMISWYQDL